MTGLCFRLTEGMKRSLPDSAQRAAMTPAETPTSLPGLLLIGRRAASTGELFNSGSFLQRTVESSFSLIFKKNKFDFPAAFVFAAQRR